jgi:hypothetical protein
MADTEIFITVTTKTSSFSATAVGKGKVSKGKYFLQHTIILTVLNVKIYKMANISS